MQFSRALRALPVVFCLGPSAPDASLAAQARYRITTDGAWFFQEAGGKRLARLARGAQVAGGDARGDWLAVTLEGWIFATSVGPTPRAGFDLAVTRTPEENLRSAPAGALVGKLPQGFLLTRVADGAMDRWVHVTRTGWVQKGDVEPIAAVVSSRTAADSDTVVATPPPGRSPGVAATPEPPGHRPGVSRGDTSGGAPDPTRVESARRTVLYRAPEGAPTGTLAPAAPLRVLSRSGDWTRVEIDGWVRSGDLQAAPAGVLVGVSAAELRARLQRKLEALPEDKAYQVLDYVEFLESKYADRPAGAAPFQKVAETLEDTLRAGRVPVNIIRGTMDAVGKAGKMLEKFAAAGKAAVEQAAKKPPEKVEEPPPPQ